MNASRRTALKASVATTALSLLPRSAFAAFPERPIRLIVPFGAGGNADIVARLVGELMTEALGQPIVVDNRAGAGGSLGAEVVARATPDGYTLLTGSNGPLTVNPFVQAKLGYDPLKDFAPIGLTSQVPHALIVNAMLPARSVPELVALSKQQQVGIGTSGIGSATHMTLIRFNAATGAKLVHIPYKSGGSLLPDLIAGNIQGAMTEFSTALPHHKSGKARFIAVASVRRTSLASEVATMIEGGIAGFTGGSYVGILAPTGTPADVIARLQSALAKSLASDKLQERLRELGAEIATGEQMTAAGFAAFIRAEFESMRQAAQAAELKKE